ncbi:MULTISPECIES: SLC13 family permease [Salimicrobium]|uniref:Sodium-dependent dicarboxylate transporter SdcS n=2 Tax=Salimicrobium TaxID=351195 RepID=A0ABY1KTW6_9BACI|nr:MULTISPECIES: DASS family sodium-coupled anion symporter [Salimicrobium]SDY13349.1 solute carrier family 13 (sodium-dependent dicarboxylate transporter), member 2/3/5 [Salimicrobium album]SIS76748.1 solute carrier family 13 (sodium-dependent dicarboxylate transporter), member 2/3/5 [Salimicrobium salexigens]
MISATWNWLWEKHDQAKELLSFFVKPNNSGTSTGKATDSERSARPDDDNGGPSYSKVQWIGLIIGPLLFVLTLLFFQPEGMSDDAQAVLASTLWVASWWMTEAAPIPLTSLLPIILFPLTGGLGMDETASSYGDDTIFLFMGGFMIALAMEKWNLHKRIALSIILVIGTNTERIILGFMVATGFLSMWISNTATAMMMVPIGLAIIYQVSEQLKDDDSIDTSKENFGFGKALMLGIAYSASIGGVSTLIGTPPNTAFAAIAGDLYGVEISFARWMLFGVPVAWTFLFIAWFYLIKVAYPLKLKTLPGGRDVIKKEKDAIGRAGFEEKVILVVFILAAFSWITRSFLLQEFVNENINDAVIALTASVILFLIPAKNEKGGRILDWDTAVKLPWGILLLFGGGLAIAGGFSASGLSEWLGNQLTILEGVNLFVVLLAVTVMVIFLTEITSNTATANMMYPIMASLAVALGVHPYAVMIAAGVASSSAFMLPVATPPNAVVFGSGYLRIPDMAKAGIALNFVGVIIVTLAVYFWLPVAWGIDLTEVPEMLKNPN